jgi:5-methyltetrahydrofolate corrinoid/iron sulfur protein methyltransferase
MIAVGERINGMFKDVKKAIRNKDKAILQDLAIRQTKEGAKYLDINTGVAVTPEEQPEVMKWMVHSVQEVCDTPLALDSQKIPVLEAGLSAVRRPAMINSCKCDEAYLDQFIPLAVQHGASLVVLTMTDKGPLQDVDSRIEAIGQICGKALEHGLELDRIFIDPVIFPVNVDQKQPGYLMQVFQQIKVISDPPPHTIVGLSNVSQGTQERPLINRTMLVMSIAAGLDAAIMDVLDTDLMDAALCAEMLLNKQIYSESFLRAGRM